jgi:hypothetical protein
MDTGVMQSHLGSNFQSTIAAMDTGMRLVTLQKTLRTYG